VSASRPRSLPPLTLALAVWGLAAALYLTGFFHRVAPAVLTGELMAGFGLTAAALGNLSALYYYSYVPFQIPFGALADRFGPRKVLTGGALLTSAGALTFAAAPTYGIAGTGRFLVGAGAGVAFVCMLKLASHWFHPRHFAMLAGCALLCGAVGAVSAGAPLRMATEAYGWRMTIGTTAALTLLLALAIWLMVRDDPEEWRYASHLYRPSGGAPRHTLLGGVLESLQARNVRLIFVVSSGVSGAPLTFGGLWGVPFLTTHYGYSPAAAAALTSLVLLCWALPSPLMGFASDRLRRRKPIYAATALVAASAWAAVVLVPGLPHGVLVALLVTAGCASAGVMIGYAYAKESAPAALAGTTTGIINTGNMLGGMLMQPAVGWILDRYWDGTVSDGVRIYPFEAYRAGFTLMLACLAVSLVVVGFTRETNCRQTR
jgi:sugar phosphate permease